jgi:deazaflavin-dependent oxidoreductase (nitroreductase family)
MSDARSLATDRAPRLVPLLNPLVGRLMRAGLPFGPNVLLTVRGRRTGIPRTFPVALMRAGDRLLIQSPYGEVDWVRNLRVAGDALLTRGRLSERVETVELEPEVAGPLIRQAVAGYMRRRWTAAVARLFIPLDRDAGEEAYVEHARHHPTFELRPR